MDQDAWERQRNDEVEQRVGAQARRLATASYWRRLQVGLAVLVVLAGPGALLAALTWRSSHGGAIAIIAVAASLAIGALGRVS